MYILNRLLRTEPCCIYNIHSVAERTPERVHILAHLTFKNVDMQYLLLFIRDHLFNLLVPYPLSVFLISVGNFTSNQHSLALI